MVRELEATMLDLNRQIDNGEGGFVGREETFFVRSFPNRHHGSSGLARSGIVRSRTHNTRTNRISPARQSNNSMFSDGSFDMNRFVQPQDAGREEIELG